MSLFVRPQDLKSKSRTLRHRDTRRKLSSILFDSLSRLDEVAVIGSDPLVTHFAVSLGLEAASLATCQAMLDERPVTLVGVPSRHWFRPEAMKLLLALKGSMEKCGRPCVLLPQRASPALTVTEDDDAFLFVADDEALDVPAAIEQHQFPFAQDCLPGPVVVRLRVG